MTQITIITIVEVDLEVERDKIMSSRGKIVSFLILLEVCCLAIIGLLLAEPAIGMPDGQMNDDNQGPTNGLQDTDIKIRIALTRDISFGQGNQSKAPDVSYFAEIGVGSPAKVFRFAIDTSVSEIWLPRYNWFPFAKNLHYSKGYTRSSSGSSLTERIKLEHRKTILSGEAHLDVFTLDGMLGNGNGSNQVWYLQRFLAVDSASNEKFRWKPYDGVFGLAPTPVPTVSMAWKSFFLSSTDERDQYPISVRCRQTDLCELPNKALYSLWINPDQESSNGGELMLGSIDENRFAGQIFYHQSESDTDWSLKLTEVLVGAEVVSSGQNLTIRVDTGSNMILGPSEDVAKIYARLEANVMAVTIHRHHSEVMAVNCDNLDELPDLMFIINSSHYYMNPRQYTRKFHHLGTQVCQLMIEAGDSSNWSLGTSFLGAHHSVFDLKDMRVGFAKARAL